MGSDRLSPDEERTKSLLPAITAFDRGLRRRRPTDRPATHTDAEELPGGKSGAFRAAIFGVSDGLVSNVALIMGVAGAGVSNDVVLVAGLAGLLAGAFSMGAGEYISMRAQREVFERLIELERRELSLFPEEETSELSMIYRRKGIPNALADQLAEHVSSDPEIALDTHAREELGLDPEEGLGAPFGASLASFLMFAAGAATPLLPFLITDGGVALIASAVLSAATLFLVGASISVVTGRSLWTSGFRQLLVGVVAAGVTYGVGSLLGVTVG
jgi:VIT1/CCC1 family predicted Fe2+/Mn2+ transporter